MTDGTNLECLNHIINCTNDKKRTRSLYQFRTKQAIIDIMATIDNLFNEYGKRLTAFLPGLKDSQLEFAYLIKAEINFSNIAILLRKSKPSITKISKSFDEYLEKNMEGLDIKTFLHDF